MPRKQRIWYPGAIYHVMSRGNRRAAIFKEQCDYMIFLEYLKMVKEKHPFMLHSICLMTNHFHMLIETGNIEIWKIMQKFLSVYAADFNYRHSYNGHLFDSRYTSCLIENDIYFLEVSRYIHLNPVKAHMVREPLAYEYSSYGWYVSEPEQYRSNKARCSELIAELVDTERVLSLFRQNSREQYRMFVEGKISHAEQELLIQKDMKEDDNWLPW